MIAAAVADLARQTFGLEVGSAQPLTGGCLNEVWRLHCPDHDRVLRIGRPERTLAQARYERALARLWADAGAPVVVAEAEPVVVDLTDGPQVLTLYPFRGGRPGTEVDPLTRLGAMTPAVVTLHRTSLPLDLPQRPGTSSIDDAPVGPRWEIIRAAVRARFGAGPEVLTPIDVIDRAVAGLDGEVQGWRAAGRLQPRAAVHGDLNPRNQLYGSGNDATDRLVGLVDTDDCRIEPLAWDAAGLASSDPAVDPDDAFELYRRLGGPLPATARELLLPLARMGTLTELQWTTDDDGAATPTALRLIQVIAGDLTGRPVRG